MRVYPFAIQRYPHYIMICNPILYGWIFCLDFTQRDERKSGGAIVEIFGKVKKISDTDGTIVMADGCKIRLSDIVDLSIG